MSTNKLGKLSRIRTVSTAVVAVATFLLCLSQAGATAPADAGAEGASLPSGWQSMGDSFDFLFELSTGNGITVETTNRAVAFGDGLALSNDAGQTWTKFSLSNFFPGGVSHTTPALSAATFPSEDVGYVLLTDEQGTVFKTSDRGQTWTRLGPKTRASCSTLAATESENLVLLCSNDSSGNLVMWRSTNGGETFSRVKSKALSGIGGQEFEANKADGRLFVDDIGYTSDGYYLGSGIAYSDDGGGHWTKIHTPGSFRSVDFVSKSSGYLLSKRGALYKTSNGGKRWKKVLSAAVIEGFDVSFSDATHGYLSGSDDVSGPYPEWWSTTVVYRTDDGGQTWDPQPLPYFGGKLGRVWAIDPGTAVATGALDFYRTTSGGSWGKSSKLRVSTKKSAEWGKSVTVTGKLTPAAAGEKIAVQAIPLKGGNLRYESAVTGADGYFSATFKMRDSSVIAASWLGNSEYTSAGSKAVVVRVTGVKRRLPKGGKRRFRCTTKYVKKLVKSRPYDKTWAENGQFIVYSVDTDSDFGVVVACSKNTNHKRKLADVFDVGEDPEHIQDVEINVLSGTSLTWTWSAEVVDEFGDSGKCTIPDLGLYIEKRKQQLKGRCEPTGYT